MQSNVVLIFAMFHLARQHPNYFYRRFFYKLYEQNEPFRLNKKEKAMYELIKCET